MPVPCSKFLKYSNRMLSYRQMAFLQENQMSKHPKSDNWPKIRRHRQGSKQNSNRRKWQSKDLPCSLGINQHPKQVEVPAKQSFCKTSEKTEAGIILCSKLMIKTDRTNGLACSTKQKIWCRTSITLCAGKSASLRTSWTSICGLHTKQNLCPATALSWLTGSKPCATRSTSSRRRCLSP